LIQFLGKVLRSRRTATGKIDNFQTETLSLKVEIKEPSRNTYRMPKSITGKTYTIRRTFLKNWSIQKGEYVVLNPEETRECIKALGKSISTRKYKDFTIADADGDGLSEIIYENPFLKAVIAPHYGARLKELWNKGTGKNEMYGGGFFKDRGYIEMGGIEETLAKQGAPDEIWNAYFKRKHIKKRNIVRFKYKLKNSIEMEKRFSFYKRFPGLLETISFSPIDIKKTKGKKKRVTKNIKLTQRVFFAMGGVPDYRNKIYIPAERELKSYRFNKPLYKSGWGNHNWWDWLNLHYSPDPPLIILKRENTRDVVILFLDKHILDFTWLGNRKRTPRLQITYKNEKIKNKSSRKYNLLVTIANKFSFTRSGILLVSKEVQQNERRILCFVHYSRKKNKKQDITIESNGKKVSERMKKLRVPGISGSFFYYCHRTESSVSEITGRLKSKNMKVRVNLE
jgi:hypothetical protein